MKKAYVMVLVLVALGIVAVSGVYITGYFVAEPESQCEITEITYYYADCVAGVDA